MLRNTNNNHENKTRTQTLQNHLKEILLLLLWENMYVCGKLTKQKRNTNTKRQYYKSTLIRNSKEQNKANKIKKNSLNPFLIGAQYWNWESAFTTTIHQIATTILPFPRAQNLCDIKSTTIWTFHHFYRWFSLLVLQNIQKIMILWLSI